VHLLEEFEKKTLVVSSDLCSNSLYLCPAQEETNINTKLK
jgi:hypothetical protein